MYILHSVKKKTWKLYEGRNLYGQYDLQQWGFIHCSEISTYQLVAPNFKEDMDERVLLVIDTEKVDSKILWEDLEDCGVAFPHIYGLLNLSAVSEVLPHLWSEDRTWVMNDELKKPE